MSVPLEVSLGVLKPKSLEVLNQRPRKPGPLILEGGQLILVFWFGYFTAAWIKGYKHILTRIKWCFPLSRDKPKAIKEAILGQPVLTFSNHKSFLNLYLNWNAHMTVLPTKFVIGKDTGGTEEFVFPISYQMLILSVQEPLFKTGGTEEN